MYRIKSVRNVLPHANSVLGLVIVPLVLQGIYFIRVSVLSVVLQESMLTQQ